MAGKSCPRTIRLRYYMTILHHDPGGACLLARRARLLQMGGKAPAHRDRMGGEQKAQKSVFLSFLNGAPPLLPHARILIQKIKRTFLSQTPFCPYVTLPFSPYIYTAICTSARCVSLHRRRRAGPFTVRRHSPTHGGVRRRAMRRRGGSMRGRAFYKSFLCFLSLDPCLPYVRAHSSHISPWKFSFWVFFCFSLTRPISPICQSPFFPYLPSKFFVLGRLPAS